MLTLAAAKRGKKKNEGKSTFGRLSFLPFCLTFSSSLVYDRRRRRRQPSSSLVALKIVDSFLQDESYIGREGPGGGVSSLPPSTLL